MAKPTAKHIQELKLIVRDYLYGEPIRVIHNRLAALAEELDSRCETLFESIDISQPSEDVLIIAILAHLNIKKSEDPANPGRYEKLIEKSTTLHDLLKHLAHDGELQVAYLLRLIDTTTPKYNWPVIFGISALISALLGAFAYFENTVVQALGQWLARTFPLVVEWLGKTFCLLHKIPLLGLIYNGLGLAWYWYSAFANGSTTTDEKVSALLFKSLSSSFAILAYSLSYFAAGLMTGLPATLFVLSSSVGVFRSIYIWYKSAEVLATLKEPEYRAEWEVQAEYQRALNYNERAQQSIWIELGAAILTTSAVAIWCFFPPSLAVSAFCITFMMLTGLAEKSMLSHFEESSATHLQRVLRDLPKTREPLLSLESSDNYAKIQQMYEELTRKEALQEQKFAQREAELAAREADFTKRIHEQALVEQKFDQLLREISSGLDTLSESIRNIRHPENSMPSSSFVPRHANSASASATPITTFGGRRASVHTLFKPAAEPPTVVQTLESSDEFFTPPATSPHSFTADPSANDQTVVDMSTTV